MARPSKTVAVLQNEKKSHRTKQEIAAREAGEAALATGKKLRERKEVRGNAIAHQEFKRLAKLLSVIGKNDALYEGVINRYCMLQAECADFESKREMFSSNLENLMGDAGLEPNELYRLQAQMQKSILDIDKQIQAKRRMMLDLEKECAMTVASAMRSIPKTPTKKENPLLEVLKGNDGY